MQTCLFPVVRLNPLFCIVHFYSKLKLGFAEIWIHCWTRMRRRLHFTCTLAVAHRLMPCIWDIWCRSS